MNTRPEDAPSMKLPAHAFPIVPLSFRLRSAGLRFPAFAGSIWHGGLGRELARVCPPAFARLYGTADAARLYALQPPPGEVFPPGSELTLRLTLFGAAGEHTLACTQALLELGERGLDPAGRYRLLRASVVQPAGEQLFYSADEGLRQPPATSDLGDWLRAAAPTDELEIRLRTPLCCKQGNALLRSAPEYAPLLQRLFGRLDQLAHAMRIAAPLSKAQRGALYDEARGVRLSAAAVHWQTLSRRSARSGQQMTIGGLLGRWRYSGTMALTRSWLSAGQILQIGGKTAFGFGAYDVVAGPLPPLAMPEALRR